MADAFVLAPTTERRKRKKPDRNPRDLYETPAWCTRLLIETYPGPLSVRVAEPCAGRGAIVDVLRDHGGATVTASDLYPDAAAGIVEADATNAADMVRVHCGADAWVTNPPYGPAESIARNLLVVARRNPVWLLVRLSFLEPTAGRRDLLDLRPEVIILPRRPKYSGASGSDSVTSCWVGWNTGNPGRITWPSQ